MPEGSTAGNSGARADAYEMLNLNCQFAWISNHHGNTLLGISVRVFSEQFKLKREDPIVCMALSPGLWSFTV